MMMTGKIVKTLACALMTGLIGWSAHAVSATIPDVPLIASTSVEPNIHLTLDDSGSMHWEGLPDDVLYVIYIFPRANGIYGAGDYANVTVDTDPANPYACFLRSPHNNRIYYDPSVRYFPWSKEDGSLWPDADPHNAFHNPANTGAGARDLTTTNTQHAQWRNSDGSLTWDTRSFFPATYFLYDGSGSIYTCDSYDHVTITPANAPFPKAADRTDCAGSTCSYAEEIQNFANWYSYHRSRILAARAGVGRAFSSLGENVRVGFGTINQSNHDVDGVNTRSVILGVRRFEGSDRQAFFDLLYNRTMPPAGTPLRRAADDAGQYFMRTDDRGPWSSTPGDTGGDDYSCRQSFHIITTDGYWNSSAASTAAARANNDGTAGPTITGPSGQTHSYTPVSPFEDNAADTLADVAMYYWKNDLRTDIANEVPTNYIDPAFWQHLVTFGIALGLVGTIDPDDAFDAIHTQATINWPNPITNTTTARVDDLLHAAVNGRGGFFTADNPNEFAEGLRKSLENIVARIGSGASVVANSTSITTNTLVFQANFDSSHWSGNLLAYQVSSGGVAATPFWEAAAMMPGPSQRKVFISTGGNIQPFQWSHLSTADQSLLGGDPSVIDYLRGDRSNELSNGGSFRNRGSHVLGDIIHSPPFYVRDTNTVFIGANDGMLHAFDSTTGEETFAFIPSALTAKLSQLSDPAYTHSYYVDGDITVSSQAVTSGHNYLVAALGRGGKGLFALDVTTPGSFGSSSDLLWEYFDKSDSDLGYMVGKVTITKLNDGSTAAIIGNGYHSDSGEAVLYLFDLASGTLIRKIGTGATGNNGLSSPTILDFDNDGDADYVYAGDLNGNLWKFDLTGNTPTSWSVQSIFTAKDPSGNPQPITGQPTVAYNTLIGSPNYGKLYVFFGTGSFIFDTDPSDTQVQSWYALIDDGTLISGRSDLKQRAISNTGTLAGKDVRTFQAASSGDMAGMKGWYLDFPAGERMVTGSVLHKLIVPTLIGSSIVPDDDPCAPGGSGYVNLIDPFTGGSVTEIIIDIDNDDDFDNQDKLGNEIVGSVNPDIGMPGAPIVVGNRLVVGGSSGGMTSFNVNLGAVTTGRLMWREIIILD